MYEIIISSKKDSKYIDRRVQEIYEKYVIVGGTATKMMGKRRNQTFVSSEAEAILDIANRRVVIKSDIMRLFTDNVTLVRYQIKEAIKYLLVNNIIS